MGQGFEGLGERKEANAGAAVGEVLAVGGEMIAGVELLEFAEGVLGDGTVAVGLVMEERLVAEDDFAIAGRHEIDFNGIDAEVAGGQERREGVFGVATTPSAMANE